MRRLFLSLLLVLSICSSSFSQERKELHQEVADIAQLFDNDMFTAVEAEVGNIYSRFSDIPDRYKTEFDAYKAMSSIILNRPNVEGIVEDFNTRYPHSKWRVLIDYHLSCYYFNKENYRAALDVMTAMEHNSLPREEMLHYMYNRAYSNMRVGSNEKALSGFSKIISLGRTKYLSPATYYTAYIHYISKDFKEAIQFFSRLEEDATYSSLSKYFKAESYFMLKNYQYVVTEGVKDFRMQEGEYRSRLARIISESFFSLNRSKEAKEYFEMYSSTNDNISRKDIYYSGIVSYSLGSYRSAINAFEKVVSKSDTLGQSAYLYLGNSYLQVKNKFGAMNAFRNASECSFDISAKDDAFFQYAKLSFDLNGDISIFNRYIEQFPSSSRSDEIYNYIATAYLLKKDFKSAIDALSKIGNLDADMAENFQKAAFFRAMEMVERRSYKSAIENLNLSNQYGNNDLTLLSNYWLAECYYRLDDFPTSISMLNALVVNDRFKRFTEYPTALYNLGYSYFKNEEWDNAMNYFYKYLGIKGVRKRFTLEARIRVADCLFMKKDYKRSAEMFEGISKLESNLDPVYAAYMGAMSYGLISELDKKIAMLDNLVKKNPRSTIFTNALFELGRSYVQANEPKMGEKCFKRLIDNPPDSVYYAKSLIELGMIRSNVGEYTSAVNYFRQVVESAPFSEDAKNALSGMEMVYQVQNKPEEYLAYLDGMGLSSIKSSSEKEVMLFNSAEQLFLSGRYNDAVHSLKSFLAAYPNGHKAPQANFYLGETLRKLGKVEAAADAFYQVMKKGGTSFSELSTLNYAEISYGLERYKEAIMAYETLYEVAKLPNNRFEALYGMMNSYYANGDYKFAITRAETIIASDNVPQEQMINAKYTVVKSRIALGERASAIPLAKELAGNKLSDAGAECTYLLIEDAFDGGDFKTVEEMVYAFSDAKTQQLYWLAKSFILLGDSFAERDDWEQAEATYQSIKDGYEPRDKKDDVLDQVNMRIEKIAAKKNEKKES